MEITCDICGEPWPGPLVRVRDEAVATTKRGRGGHCGEGKDGGAMGA